MNVVGTVESLWRYPVKSMRGEECDEIFIEAAGVRGDRMFAFRSSAAPEMFPYFTAREQRQMLRFQPQVAPPDAAATMVVAPSGETLAIDDPALIQRLRSGVDERHHVTLMHSDRPLTDAQPVSVISLQTVRKLGEEIGTATDKRQFRANVYLDLPGSDGFAENAFVGRSIRIGRHVVLSVAERDVRCMMITIHPDTAEKTPALLKQVVRQHEGAAGVYASVISEGVIRKGDAVELLP